MIDILAGRGGSAPVDIVDRLLREWRTLPELMSASRERLLAVSGNDDAVAAILRFKATLRHVLRTRVATRPVLNSTHAIFAYLKSELAHRAEEELRVFYLTGRNHLIREEVACFGTLDECKAYPREIIRRALELGAANLVLAHNHPSGDCEPSKSDVAFTNRLNMIAVPLGICVLDHIIVGTQSCTSLRKVGIYCP